jgi:hypothetical protein
MEFSLMAQGLAQVKFRGALGWQQSRHLAVGSLNDRQILTTSGFGLICLVRNIPLNEMPTRWQLGHRCSLMHFSV